MVANSAIKRPTNFFAVEAPLVLLLLYKKNIISKYVNFCIRSKPSLTFPQMALFLNFGALCAIRL